MKAVRLHSTVVAPECRPFYFRRGTEAVLLVHGFTGCPKEMLPLGEYLQERGYSVLGVRLKGHGISEKAMARSRWQQWVASARAGLLKLQANYSTIHLCGLSMGGSICLYLASEHNVASVTTLAAPVVIRDKRLILLPFARKMLSFVPVMGQSDLVNKDAEKELWHYTRVPVRCIDSLMEFLKETRLRLHKVRSPLFVAHGDQDKSVNPKNAHIIYLEAGSTKKMKKIYHSGHGMTVDVAKEELFSDILAFIRNPEAFE